MYTDAKKAVNFNKMSVFYNDICFSINSEVNGHENYQGIGDTGEYKLESRLDFNEMFGGEEKKKDDGSSRGNDGNKKHYMYV